MVIWEWTYWEEIILRWDASMFRDVSLLCLLTCISINTNIHFSFSLGDPYFLLHKDAWPGQYYSLTEDQRKMTAFVLSSEPVVQWCRTISIGCHSVGQHAALLHYLLIAPIFTWTAMKEQTVLVRPWHHFGQSCPFLFLSFSVFLSHISFQTN